MPIKPLKRRKERETGLSFEQIEYLICGHNLLSQKNPPFADESEIKPSWEENKDFILSLQGQQQPGYNRGATWFDYGRRPWAWWQWDAPEQRRESETEFQYIDRLNLWFPWEREALKRQQKAKEIAENNRRKLAKKINFEEKNATKTFET